MLLGPVRTRAVHGLWLPCEGLHVAVPVNSSVSEINAVAAGGVPGLADGSLPVALLERYRAAERVC